MYDSVPHTRPVLITGSLTHEQERRAAGLVSTRGSTYQGPTSIVNMVHESLSQRETPSVSLMAHLPQYVQLDEDHMGAARLMSVLCAMYDLPESLVDESRGEQQYSEINRAVQNNSEVRALIQQLETYYDRTYSIPDEPEEEEPVSLSPGLERFLYEVGGRLEDPVEDDEDDDRDDDPEPMGAR